MLDVIVVEDNKEIGKLLFDFLQKEHYTVSVVETGEKAIELFERYGAKLVILDLMLPGVDGFAVCSRIRESSNAHILIASARTQKEDKLKGLNLGADDYLDKPYDVDILLAKINGIFKRKYLQEEMAHIFDSFYRGSNSEHVRGSGLGLYISKELLHKMDGEIYAGTTKDNEFTVTIVLRKI